MTAPWRRHGAERFRIAIVVDGAVVAGHDVWVPSPDVVGVGLRIDGRAEDLAAEFGPDECAKPGCGARFTAEPDPEGARNWTSPSRRFVYCPGCR